MGGLVDVGERVAVVVEVADVAETVVVGVGLVVVGDGGASVLRLVAPAVAVGVGLDVGVEPDHVVGRHPRRRHEGAVADADASQSQRGAADDRLLAAEEEAEAGIGLAQRELVTGGDPDARRPLEAMAAAGVESQRVGSPLHGPRGDDLPRAASDVADDLQLDDGGAGELLGAPARDHAASGCGELAAGPWVDGVEDDLAGLDGDGGEGAGPPWTLGADDVGGRSGGGNETCERERDRGRTRERAGESDGSHSPVLGPIDARLDRCTTLGVRRRRARRSCRLAAP